MNRTVGEFWLAGKLGDRTMKLRSFARRHRVLSLFAACTLVLSGFVWTASPGGAASPCPLPGGFEIDGDMQQATCTPAGDDWNTPGLPVQSTTQGGTYSTAGKDGDNPSTWVSSGSTPNKTDFARAYAFSQVVGGHFFAYVAWERTATKGTQGYAIEIDNAGSNVAADGTPQPNRSKGGFVFYISAQGGGLPSFAGDCTFTSQSDYGSTCSNSAAGFDGAFNSNDITDTFTNLTVLAGGFDEVGLDVTTLTGIAPSCPGPSAASLYLRSVTGQTSNGNLKGYLAPFDIAPNSTCVPPPISTTATPGNGTINGLQGVVPGSSQHDHAVVGTGQAPGVGTVAFFLCSPAQVATNGGDCSSGGTHVTPDQALDGTGNADSAAISGSTDTTPGKYCWRAEFTPGANDHNYLPGTHTNSDTECFTVLHGTPTVSTQIHDIGNDPGTIGFSTLTDTATFEGIVGTPDGAHSTVGFSLYGPFAAGVTPVCNIDHFRFGTLGALTATGNAGEFSATTGSSFTPTLPGTYVWSATWPGDSINDSATEACNQPTEKETISAASLTLVKTPDNGTVSAGDQIGFKVTVTNTGAGTAHTVTISDPLPSGAGVNWQTGSGNASNCSVGGTAPSQTLDCTGVNLAQNESYTAHVVSGTTLDSCGQYVNTATASAENATSPEPATATVTVECPVITFTKVSVPAVGPVNAGSPIGFTVSVSNSAAAGTGTAHGVTIADPLPSGSGIDWHITTQSGAACQINPVGGGQELDCNIGDLAPGASYTVTISSSTAFASCADYTNTASLTGSNFPKQTAEASLTVQCPTLQITKTHDAAVVNAGESIGFTVEVTNAGPGIATSATLADPLPAGSGVSWSIDPAYSGPGTCTISGSPQELDCAFGDLASGADISIHITSATAFASCGVYDNKATLSATNAPDKDASASTEVDCPDVSLVKTADAESVSAGQPIGFTITASNADNANTGTAKGIAINDPLPGGNGVDWSIESGPDNCSITGAAPTQTLVCTPVDLGPGESEVVHLTSDTAFESCGVYDNTATLSLTNGPLDPTTGLPVTFTSEATTTVNCPALGITKVADAAKVNPGQQIGFTVHVTNTGLGTALGAVIQDPLPAHPGADWSIESTTGLGTGTCAIAGPVGHQVLTCELGDFAPGGDVAIHIVASTTSASCGVYDNTATLSAGNSPSFEGIATTQVNCIGVSPQQPPPLATTGAGPINSELVWALGLIGAGLLLLVAARRRRAAE